MNKALLILLICIISVPACLPGGTAFAVTGDVSIEGKLDVTGTGNVSGLLTTGSISVDGDTLNTDIVNHRVGVGTFVPTYKFDITGDLRSTRYIMGTGPDLSIIPVVGGQSVITSWHGMQLVGNRQLTVDYTPVNIGGANDFSVIVPNQAAAAIGLVVQGAAGQTGNLQAWRDSTNTTLLNVNSAGNINKVGSNLTFTDATVTSAVNLSELTGWYGSVTRIKLMPSDFVSDDGDDNFTMASAFGAASSGTAQVYANIPIPTGFTATAVLVYGSDATNAITVYNCVINDGTTATSLGTGNVGTEIDITDTASTATNYLSIFVNTGNADQVFGGYVTIAKI